MSLWVEVTWNGLAVPMVRISATVVIIHRNEESASLGCYLYVSIEFLGKVSLNFLGYFIFLFLNCWYFLNPIFNFSRKVRIQSLILVILNRYMLSLLLCLLLCVSGNFPPLVAVILIIFPSCLIEWAQTSQEFLIQPWRPNHEGPWVAACMNKRAAEARQLPWPRGLLLAGSTGHLEWSQEARTQQSPDIKIQTAGFWPGVRCLTDWPVRRSWTSPRFITISKKVIVKWMSTEYSTYLCETHANVCLKSRANTSSHTFPFPPPEAPLHPPQAWPGPHPLSSWNVVMWYEQWHWKPSSKYLCFINS